MHANQRCSYRYGSSTSTRPTNFAIRSPGISRVNIPRFNCSSFELPAEIPSLRVPDSLVTPEIFASHLCEDLRLPQHPFYKEMVAQIHRHIEEAHLTEEYMAHLGDDLGSVREDNKDWFDRRTAQADPKPRMKAEDYLSESGPLGEVTSYIGELADSDPSAEEGPMSLEEFGQQEGPDQDLRILIKLDITLDSYQLVDKFEWDLADPYNSPEAFAEAFAADLGLPGEFRCAAASPLTCRQSY